VGGIGFIGANMIIDTNAVSGTYTDHGIAQSIAGAIYGTTTTAGSDVFKDGLRLTLSGQLVYAQANPAQVINGNPLDANGALCIA
jgi:hypothetical protein